VNLNLEQIRRDDSAQPRAMLNTDHIKDLADALEGDAELTPVEVFHDGHSYWLADGFHRYSAYHRAKRSEIPVNIHEGDLRAAVLYSITANAKHAVLKLTRDERRVSVMKLLSDSEWSLMSNREIARLAGVSEGTVRNMRPDLTAQITQSNDSEPTTTLRKGADGRTINTANIGSKPPPSPAPHPRHPQTYSPPLTPEEPEEDDRLEHEPPELEAEVVYDETDDEDEPYIPPYVSNPVKLPFELKKLSNEPKPKEPPFVDWYVLLGRVQSKGHRSLIEALNSLENVSQEQALEVRIADVIEMLRASLKQAEIERRTVTA